MLSPLCLSLCQAVRNKVDLNVTAMPAKYRKMADFHEYYSGARSAPYLTIFIGGNHEASNHLFELYYGGWVAPNIYYMGAANILRLGPLRIAGLSGIWKGYDYRKPHFERLPYNEAEFVSIFHVRELDVRKMLSVRTQVDIGISHDWPQGVEWKGDYRWLFRKKDRFEADASEGKLGSVAARQCLDRLRPRYWFSAHLHIKYAAIIQHGDYEWVRPPREHRPRHGVPLAEKSISGYNSGTGTNFTDIYNTHPEQGGHQDLHLRTTERPTNETATSPEVPTTVDHNLKAGLPQTTPEQAQVSAWQNFHAEATKAEAEDIQMRLREQRGRTVEEKRTGTRASTQYTFDETWKQVQVGDGEERGIASVLKSIKSPGDDIEMSNMDGCVESRLKRSRMDSPDGLVKNGQMTHAPKPSNGLPGQLDGQVPITEVNASRNTDEIEIGLSDSSSEDAEAGQVLPCSNPGRLVATEDGNGGSTQAAHQNPNKRMKPEAIMSDDSDEGGVKLDPTCAPFVPRARASFQPSLIEDRTEEEATTQSITTNEKQERVSDSLRAQLAELSSSFAPNSSQPIVSAALPFPESIANTKTQFLALDKCERGRDFLQLLEVEPISQQPHVFDAGPYQLQYDKEWLAILRVFAPELELGGDASGKIPPHKGETYYRDRITAEEEWIEEHVAQAGRLTVPHNFITTAPIYDAKEEVAVTAMPREYSNPQTSAFCELVGIENKFDMSEEERDMRVAHGPHPLEKPFSRVNHGGGRGGRNSGLNARGRGGHYNRGRGGRGRGGRGGGRGGW